MLQKKKENKLLSFATTISDYYYLSPTTACMEMMAMMKDEMTREYGATMQDITIW
eukprot:CAMPEP_0194724764 /NCGR_PEP_ID=MMETSP0296-20130528/23531_1 /TAXON_ID=39354 /ORGANISM="Heterosigma akashiwo, Strain CCMP2393" /LENGTH=54 /DNA_ID=CAMNT_0039628913 /DNA_START=19 /DNA_END=186 /DNA_ORIENTATION=-